MRGGRAQEEDASAPAPPSRSKSGRKSDSQVMSNSRLTANFASRRPVRANYAAARCTAMPSQYVGRLLCTLMSKGAFS